MPSASVNTFKALLDSRQASTWNIWLKGYEKPVFVIKKINEDTSIIYPLENNELIVSERLDLNSAKSLKNAVSLMIETFNIDYGKTGPAQ